MLDDTPEDVINLQDELAKNFRDGNGDDDNTLEELRKRLTKTDKTIDTCDDESKSLTEEMINQLIDRVTLGFTLIKLRRVENRSDDMKEED